jgi:hypothetical protein
LFSRFELLLIIIFISFLSILSIVLLLVEFADRIIGFDVQVHAFFAKADSGGNGTVLVHDMLLFVLKNKAGA